MVNEVKSVGVARKIGSVVVLLGGAVVLYGLVLGVVASLLQPGWADETFWALSLATAGVGIGIVWGGVVLWSRWRLPSAVILLFLSLWTVPKVLVARAGALQAAGVQAQWLARTAGAFLAIAALLALMGIALLVIESRRRHQAGSLGR